LIWCCVSCRRRCLDQVGLHALAPAWGMRQQRVVALRGQHLGLQAQAGGHLLPQRLAKWPVSNISTASPGLRVLASAASQAPVPDAG
jgi:hypothetical protein